MMGGRGLGYGRLLGFIQTLPSPPKFSCTEPSVLHWLTIGGRIEGQTEGSFSRGAHKGQDLHRGTDGSEMSNLDLDPALIGQSGHD